MGLAASLGASHIAQRSAEDKVAAEFTVQAETRARGLQEVLSRYEGMIEGFAASFPGAQMDHQRFQAYSRDVALASHILSSGFQSLAWAPRVVDAGRAAFETAAGREDAADFHILDSASSGVLTIAPRRTEYYPLRYIEPAEADAPIGFDLLSEATRATALRLAIEGHRAASTAPFQFLTRGWGCLIFVPVYAPATSPGAGHPTSDTPIGILSFRLFINPAIDAIIDALEPVPQGFDMYILDDGAPAGQRLVYSRATPTGGAVVRPSEATALTEPFFGSSFSFAGRDWTVVLRPTPELRAAALAHAGWYELAFGLMLTALLTVYLVSSRRRADRLHLLADGLRQEVGERRSAERRLRLTQLSMDRSSEAISLIDVEGQFLNVNDAACRLMGYSREELLQLAVFDIDPKMTPDSWQRQWQTLRESGAQSFDANYRAKSGKLIPVDITANNLEFNGREYHFSVARDATLRRRDEHEIRMAKEQAEAASRAKSEFLANMSHELRTPLNAIIGFSEVMCNELLGPMGNQHYREYAGDIRDSGNLLLAVINDILDFSRTEAGELTLNESEVALAVVVRAARRLIEQRATASHLTLETVIPEDLPALRADERLVKQMLLNLLSNAVKFTPEGGLVRIVVERGAHGELLLRVSDTGIGLTREEIGIALTPFRQVTSGLNRTHDGTGLGLPLVKSFIEMHGGSLEIESRSGAGTTATLSFPASRVIERQAPHGSAEPRSTSLHVRIA